MVTAVGTSPQSNLTQLSGRESANKSQVRALIRETKKYTYIYIGHKIGIFHSLDHNRLNSKEQNSESFVWTRQQSFLAEYFLSPVDVAPTGAGQISTAVSIRNKTHADHQ